ncbi:MAG TPA: hypothetical protein VHZ73_06600, partial [Vicinamibacterales bacterium]|nr:hypothetical protein [Vicinamibacterales bacterium]
MHTKALLTLLASLSASVFLAAASAEAQIPSRNGVIYACIRLDRDDDVGKLARLVAADEPCRRNEARVQWNVQGAAGP